MKIVFKWFHLVVGKDLYRHSLLSNPIDLSIKYLNEKMATFAEVVNNQSSNKNNTDESDSKHGEQNKDYASGDSVKPLFFISNILLINQ
jgi:hypothetical protein